MESKTIRSYQTSDFVITEGQPSKVVTKFISSFLNVYLVTINGIQYSVYSSKDLTRTIDKLNQWIERYHPGGKKIAYSTASAKLREQESQYKFIIESDEIVISFTSLNLDDLV